MKSSPSTLRGVAPTGSIQYDCRKSGIMRAVMRIVQRELYRSPRGLTPKDEKGWRLVFHCGTKRLAVRHEWETSGHSGVQHCRVLGAGRCTANGLDRCILPPGSGRRVLVCEASSSFDRGPT